MGLVLLLVLLGAPAPLEAEMSWASEPGAPLLTLRGGPLPAPLVVPLWLALAEPDPDDKCHMHDEAASFAREGGAQVVAARRLPASRLRLSAGLVHDFRRGRFVVRKLRQVRVISEYPVAALTRGLLENAQRTKAVHHERSVARHLPLVLP